MSQEQTLPENGDGLEQYVDTSEKRLSGLVYWITLFYGGFGILVAINQTFGFNAFGLVIIDNSYYYLLIGIFLPLAFLIFPAVKKHENKVPIYDWVLFAVTIAVSIMDRSARATVDRAGYAGQLVRSELGPT